MIDLIIEEIKKNIKGIGITNLIDNKGNKFIYVYKRNNEDIPLEELFHDLPFGEEILSDVMIDLKTFMKLKRKINKIINEKRKKEIRDSRYNRCMEL